MECAAQGVDECSDAWASKAAHGHAACPPALHPPSRGIPCHHTHTLTLSSLACSPSSPPPPARWCTWGWAP